ncbi:endoplasmic reticulum retention protein [Ophidiomyces ophidiicola]|uniref:endoplasmic reticulum retention protein n=1 Tax=Ophidiomyces ophidiicola TaxID=1387563 RepID=UPI0020C283EB|nr:endoplasmic reticulum retention protein [Ophidiomyces ophidiicola]KAI1952820.1 endoplasmic reticulum retention protein [Ophidiomyces ophidiicola]
MNIFRLLGAGEKLSSGLVWPPPPLFPRRIAKLTDSSAADSRSIPSGLDLYLTAEDEVVQPVRVYRLNRKLYISLSTSLDTLVRAFVDATYKPPSVPELTKNCGFENYSDIFWTFTLSAYNTIFKILFIASSAYTIYLMINEYRPTQDPNLDTFKVQYLLGASALLAMLFPYAYTPAEILWTFSIWLESVAILPQLFMLQRTGEAETITTHYLFALGLYRALYIPNWIYRYFTEGRADPIAIIAGVIQTVLYSDFFWIYYTKVMKGKKFSLPV